MSSSDVSTDFGLGGVLFLSEDDLALWFTTPCLPGDSIDVLEVKPAAVADAVFGPIIRGHGYDEELAGVDNHAGLA